MLPRGRFCGLRIRDAKQEFFLVVASQNAGVSSTPTSKLAGRPRFSVAQDDKAVLLRSK